MKALLRVATVSSVLIAALSAQTPAGSEPTQAGIIAQAERAAATLPVETAAPARIPNLFTRQDIGGVADRRCVTGSGMGPIRSGQFVIGGELSGQTRPDLARKKIPPKVWWAPLHHKSAMTLVVRGTLVGNPAVREFATSTVAFPASPDKPKPPVEEREYFFPSGIDFLLEGGTWVLVATQGPDWGCFVLTTPSMASVGR